MSPKLKEVKMCEDRLKYMQGVLKHRAWAFFDHPGRFGIGDEIVQEIDNLVWGFQTFGMNFNDWSSKNTSWNQRDEVALLIKRK